MDITVFWGVTQRGLVDSYQRFESTHGATSQTAVISSCIRLNVDIVTVSVKEVLRFFRRSKYLLNAARTALETKLRCFSPQANYNDGGTAAWRRG
jgi:hypothetical protein